MRHGDKAAKSLREAEAGEGSGARGEEQGVTFLPRPLGEARHAQKGEERMQQWTRMADEWTLGH